MIVYMMYYKFEKDLGLLYAWRVVQWIKEF